MGTFRTMALSVAAAAALAGAAQAGVVAISQSAFSGSETLLTFNAAASGSELTIAGVTFKNHATGNLFADDYDRAYLFHPYPAAPNDGQLRDSGAQTDMSITFSTVVNRVGIDLATMISYPDDLTKNYQTWSYEAFDAANTLIGGGSVSSSGVVWGDKWNALPVTGTVFLGIQSSQAIKRVRIFETSADAQRNSGQISVMDNLRFEPVAAPVPLPAAAWMGLSLLGGVGLRRHRRA